MDANLSTRTWIIIGVVAAVIIIAGGWFIYRSKTASPVVGKVDTTEHVKPDTTAAGETPAQSGTATTGASGESVAVPDQPAGTTVKITSMTLGKTSWVAVRDIEAQRILGAGRFEPGTSSGDIELIRATTAGDKYEALIYVDDGDRSFDMHKDLLVQGVSSPFTAQ